MNVGNDSTMVDTDERPASPEPQLGAGRRPPPARVSFSRHVRPSRSKLNDNGSLAAPSAPQGHGGVPLGERVYSIAESTARMSVSIPTALPKPEATPLPLLPLTVLCIVSKMLHFEVNAC